LNKVYLTKAEILTGVGNSLYESWDKLYSNESSIREIEHFDVSKIDFKYASVINSKYNKNKNLGLIRHALSKFINIPEKTFIIWTGIKGNSFAVENNSEDIILPGFYRKKVSEYLNILNTGMEINAACASSTAGIIYGAQLISSGEYKSVLVCASDIVSRFTHMGFSALRALSPEPAKPFDKNRDGLSLGDGACAVFLTDRETRDITGSDSTVFISGWGISNDANHITGPDRYASGLIESVNKTLKRSGKKAEDIEAFCTHGTGTVFNDAMELTAIENIFKDRIFPCFSVKGAIGHTLGAAGGIESALCSLCLKEKKVLPTTGLNNPENRASGRMSSEPQEFSGNNILTTNSGFGGVNASLLLERES
jgi:3-oxoacyl-[acyl-carrier-protein] synthase II